MSPAAPAGWARVEKYAKRAQWIQVIGAILIAGIAFALAVAYRAGYVVSRDGVVDAIDTHQSPVVAHRLDDHESRLRSLETQVALTSKMLDLIDKRIERIANKLGVP
jgi:hypothetical protein